MSRSRNQLIVSSVVFAVLWTAGMLWWSARVNAAHTIILIISGVIGGLVCYWLFGKWFRRHLGH